ncbi:MAG: ATP-binding protein [Saprospiraceae bacterium]
MQNHPPLYPPINWLLLILGALSFPGYSQPAAFDFLNFTHVDGLADDLVRDIQEDKKGRIWFATQRGVSCFDGKTITNYLDQPTNKTLWESWGIHFLATDASGRIWAASVNRLFYYNEKDNCFLDYGLTNLTPAINAKVFVSEIYLQDWKDEESIWFRIGPALYAIDSRTLVCQQRMTIPVELRSVWGILGKDRDGLIWTGGWDNPRIALIRSDGKIQTVLTSPVQNVRAIFQEPGSSRVWVSGANLASYDKSIGKWETWDLDIAGLGRLEGLTTVPEVSGDSILWMYTVSNTKVACYNLRRKRIQMLFNTNENSPNSLQCGLMGCRFVDSKGNIWLGGHKGCAVIIRNQKTFGNYAPLQSGKKKPGRVLAQAELSPAMGGTWKMPDGSLAEWVSDGKKCYYIALSSSTKARFEGQIRDNGIKGTRTHFDLQTGRRTVNDMVYRPGTEGKWVETVAGKESQYQLAFWPDSHGKIMIPRGEKLNPAEDITGSWYDDGILTYYFQDGDSVFFLHPEHIFAGRRKSLHIVDGLTIRLWGGCRTVMKMKLNIISPDSLVCSGTAMDNHCDLEQGKVYESVNRRYTKVEQKDTLYIRTFRIFDKIQPIDIADFSKAPFEITHSQNFISFEFNCSDPFSTLWYQLEGFDQEWFPTRSNKQATYTNLNGGTYVFRVKALNQQGIAMDHVATFYLRVHPPYYQTWWFRTLLFLAIIALIYAIFRYRELQRLQQEKLRLSIARDLHDEMGSTLSSISILSEAAMRHLQEDIDRARFGTIGARARQVMEAMSDIVWSVNPRNDSMNNILQRMKEFSVELFESQGITLHFEADETVKTLNLPMEQRKDFYLLFKEAANNAAKYSGATEVWVLVQSDNGGLRLEVRDNGKGFDPATVKQGNGLWNMQRRAERMGGALVLESKVGEGTRVELSLAIIR